MTTTKSQSSESEQPLAIKQMLERLATQASLVDDRVQERARAEAEYTAQSDTWRHALSITKGWMEFVAELKHVPVWKDPETERGYLAPTPQRVVEDQRLARRADYPDKVMAQFAKDLGPRYVTFDEGRIQHRKELAVCGSVILGGDRGTGKTTALAYLARQVARRYAHDVTATLNGAGDFAFWRSSFLVATMHKKHEQEINYGVPFLFIDDVGHEYMGTDWDLSQYEDLIEYRYARKLPTFCTVNMSKEDFLKRPRWDYMSDRLCELCSWVTFVGDSLRRK